MKQSMADVGVWMIVVLFLLVPPMDRPQAQPTTAPVQEPAHALLKELDALFARLNQIVPDPHDHTDPARRAAVASEVTPLLWRMVALSDEVARSKDAATVAHGRQLRRQTLMLLTGYGDKKAQDQLLTLANGPDPVEAAAARLAYLSGRWSAAGHDPALQADVINAMEAVARIQPGDASVFTTLAGMLQASHISDENLHRLEQIVLDHMGGDYQIEYLKERIHRARKLRSWQGKPLTIAGTTHTGQPFSSEPWKGKVVLVSFWASWGQMSRDEVALLKKLYEKYHDSGLEIVGVPSDEDLKALQTFLGEQEIPWPQLYARETPGRHPLNEELGVLGLPTTVVIDRAGVVRAIALGEELETEVAHLFSEESAAPQPGPAE